MYVALFKCRLCGEIFVSGGINNKYIVTNAMAGIVVKGDSNAFRFLGAPIFRHNPHLCNDRDYGLADFIGFRKKGDDPDDEVS